MRPCYRVEKGSGGLSGGWWDAATFIPGTRIGEVGEAAPPSVDVVGGFVSGTGRGTGLAIGGGGGGGNMGVGRNGLCTLPWLLPLGLRNPTCPAC